MKMKIQNQFSEAAPITIESAERLIDMRLSQGTMMVSGELEVLKAQVNTLKEILACVMDTVVPQEEFLNVCSVYGYYEVNENEF